MSGDTGPRGPKGDPGDVSLAQARLGIFELSSSTDRDVQDTLHLTEKSDPSEVATGNKYYVSGGDAGGLKGKVIRRTSTAFGSVTEQDFSDNFSTYWETILEPSEGGGGGGLSTVSTDETISGDGSSDDPLTITWRDEVVKNTAASSRLKLATADILVGESRDPTWGIVNSSGVAGGLAKNNADGYWNLTRAKAATYTATAITASGNGDYFVARLPLGSDTRLYAFREAGTFSGTIDEPLNASRKLGSDDDWDYYVYDVRLFGTVSLRSSTHNVGFNTWGGQYKAGSVGIDALAAAVAARLLPTGGSDGQFLGRSSSAPAWVAAPSGGGGGGGARNTIAFKDNLELKSTSWQNLFSAEANELCSFIVGDWGSTTTHGGSTRNYLFIPIASTTCEIEYVSSSKVWRYKLSSNSSGTRLGRLFAYNLGITVT